MHDGKGEDLAGPDRKEVLEGLPDREGLVDQGAGFVRERVLERIDFFCDGGQFLVAFLEDIRGYGGESSGLPSRRGGCCAGRRVSFSVPQARFQEISATPRAAEKYGHRFGYCSDAFLELISASEHRHRERELQIDLDIPGPEDHRIDERVEVMEFAELERLDPHPAPAVERGRHPDKALRIGRDRFVGKGGLVEQAGF